MLESLLNKSEYIALAVNVTMTAAFAIKGDWAKFMYWLGTCLVVGGVLRMRS